MSAHVVLSAISLSVTADQTALLTALTLPPAALPARIAADAPHALRSWSDASAATPTAKFVVDAPAAARRRARHAIRAAAVADGVLLVRSVADRQRDGDVQRALLTMTMSTR